MLKKGEKSKPLTKLPLITVNPQHSGLFGPFLVVKKGCGKDWFTSVVIIVLV